MIQDAQESTIKSVGGKKNQWRKYGLLRSPFSSFLRFSMYYLTHEWVNQLSVFNRFIDCRDKHLFLVMGAAGLGKTSFLNHLLTNAKPAANVLQIQGSVGFSLRRFCKYVSKGFSLDACDTQEDLEQSIKLLLQDGRSYMLVIDDADELPISTLAAVLHLLISNQEAVSRAQLKIVLSGRGTLLDKIRLLWDMGEPSVPHVDMTLQRLSLEQLSDYLMHRLKGVGLKGRFCLSPNALKEIYKHSEGVPLLINEAANRLAAKELLVSNLWQSSGNKIKGTRVRSKQLFSSMKRLIMLSLVVFLVGIAIFVAKSMFY